MEGWQLEGSSAEAYEKYLVPALMRRWAEQLVDLAAIAPGERVLDVGCGTGIVARTAAARAGAGGRVAAVDVNEQMLEVARAAGGGRTIEWREGNAGALPFPDGAFDAVLSQQMIQFVSQPTAVLGEMWRVLRPGGRLAVSACRAIAHSPAYVPLADALSRHVGPQAGAGMRSPFSSWSPGELRGLLEGAGFRDVKVRIDVGSVRYPSPREFLRREAASSPLAGPVAALIEAARAALVRDLEDALRPHVDDEGVVSPLETYVATGTR
jgi:ubiquinone/menaquinone biosynthesis C-methylase UbiE